MAARRSSRRRLVAVRPTVALLLLLAGGGGCGLCSPSSTCHAFAIGSHSAGNGASVGRQRSSSSGGGGGGSGGGGGGFVPLVQRLHLATLSTQDGQDEAEEAADGATTRSSNAKGTSLEDTSFDKSKQEPTRTTKAKAKGRGRRRPSPNKRTSLKWVVESVEACLCKEKGYQSEYSSHLEEEDGACDWQEQDLVLVDALWELCWGEFGLPIYLDSSRLFFRSALFVFAYIRLLSINAC